MILYILQFYLQLVGVTIDTHTDRQFTQLQLVNKKSELVITGTSTQHDWSAKALSMQGKTNITLDGNKLRDFSWLEVSVRVSSLKSEKSKLDENMHTKLRIEAFPEITFKLSNATLHDDHIQLTGNLTVAGITKPINTSAVYSVFSNEIALKGEFKVNMTDFNIEPPSLFFGTLKTGNAVHVSYSLIFN